MARPIPRKHINDLPVIVPPLMPEPDAQLSHQIRRLNLNEAPIPPSPKTIQAMTDALTDACKYPDHSCAALSKMLSKALSINENRLFFGGGSGELLMASALLCVGPGDEVVLPVPTFPTFGKGVQLSDGNIIGVPVDQNGANDVKAMIKAISPNTQVVYACTPNNPTGAMLTAEDVQYLADNVPDDILLLVDEAYQEFGAFDGGPDCLEILGKRRGLWISSRTFSKAYSLAGMRVGYGIASSAELAEAYWKVRGNFTVNRIAIAGAVAAYNDTDYRQAYLTENAAQRQRISEGLGSLGFNPYPSSANFVTARSPVPTAGFVADLHEQNILVQPMEWAGSGPCIRVSIGSNDDTNALLTGLQTSMKVT